MEWIITLLSLSIVIFVHELGHFMFARRAGIAVPEFSIGMGPKLISRKWGQTEYVLRLLPVGGFVKLGGLDEDIVVADSENYYFKTFFQRFWTLVGGALFNVIFGFLMFAMVAFLIGAPFVSTRIAALKEGSAAQLAGLQIGDQLVSSDGVPITDVPAFVNKIRQSNFSPMTVVYTRGGESRTVMLTPSGKIPQIGIQFNREYKRVGIVDSISMGIQRTKEQVLLFFLTLKMLFAGSVQFKDLMGPVGIMQLASSGLAWGMAPFFGVMATISISLGLANLLPIPMLDGGHVVFLIIEKIRGRRLPPKIEVLIVNIGAFFLIGLMILVVGNDVFHWQDRLVMLKGLK